MKNHYGENVIPFFIFDVNEKLIISTIENPIKPKSGELVIALVLDNN